MSDANESNGRAHLPDDAESVLAKLPRTRPQRATPRRAAARRAATANGTAPAAADRTGAAKQPLTAAKAKRSGRKGTATASANGAPTKAKAGRPYRAKPAAGRARRRPKAGSAQLAPAPPQGFECEWDRADGPVRPPGGADLAASAFEVLGELAKAGLAGSERLVKDVFGRLPVP